MSAKFLDEIPEFEIRDGIVKWTWGCGKAKCMPLPAFRIVTARQNKLLADHDARSAEVISIRRNKRAAHAASS